MKKSVRIIAFALVAVMVCLAFAACGKTLSGEYTAEIGSTSIAGGKTTYKSKGNNSDGFFHNKNSFHLFGT